MQKVKTLHAFLSIFEDDNPGVFQIRENPLSILILPLVQRPY